MIYEENVLVTIMYIKRASYLVVFEDKIHVLVVSGYILRQFEYVTSSMKQSIQFFNRNVARVE